MAGHGLTTKRRPPSLPGNSEFVFDIGGEPASDLAGRAERPPGIFRAPTPVCTPGIRHTPGLSRYRPSPVLFTPVGEGVVVKIV